MMDARPVCEKCSTVGVGHGHRRVVAAQPRPFAKYFKTSGMTSIFETGAFLADLVFAQPFCRFRSQNALLKGEKWEIRPQMAMATLAICIL